ASFALTGGELEVDLLERGAADLQAVELGAAREGLAGELVQQPCRLVRLDEHLAAVQPVADLGRDAPAGELRRLADRDDPALAEDGDAVGELLGLVEVVRRQKDG